MPRAYCFVGPSLPEAPALAAEHGIDVLPPVAAGDLLRLKVRAGDTVGIVDGYFHQRGAVRHKEILHLLARGIRVVGAASMGALRAAELHRFGMEGVGDVYADYRDGRLEADDEVTLLHSPAEDGYRTLSEPLVCMRATFAEAVRQGVCDARTADWLLEALAERHFGLRSYAVLPDVGAEAGLDPAAVRQLQRFCFAHRQDPKRDDALLLLERLAAAVQDTLTPRPLVPMVHRTSPLYSWELAARGIGTEHGGALALLRACQLFSVDFPTRYRDTVLHVLRDDCVRHCDAEAPHENDTQQALRHGAHRGLYCLPAARERLDFLPRWLTAAETGLSLSEQLTAFLVRSCRTAVLIPWDEILLELLREPAVLEPARQFVDSAREINNRSLKDRPHLRLDALPSAKILDLLIERWKVPVDEVDLAALDRGFTSVDTAVAAARPLYLFARYNEEASQLRLACSNTEAITNLALSRGGLSSG